MREECPRNRSHTNGGVQHHSVTVRIYHVPGGFGTARSRDYFLAPAQTLLPDREDTGQEVRSGAVILLHMCFLIFCGLRPTLSALMPHALNLSHSSHPAISKERDWRWHNKNSSAQHVLVRADYTNPTGYNVGHGARALVSAPAFSRITSAGVHGCAGGCDTPCVMSSPTHSTTTLGRVGKNPDNTATFDSEIQDAMAGI